MRDIYIKDPGGEPEYDGEEDNEEYEESMEELRFLCDSYLSLIHISEPTRH